MNKTNLIQKAKALDVLTFMYNPFLTNLLKASCCPQARLMH